MRWVIPRCRRSPWTSKSSPPTFPTWRPTSRSRCRLRPDPAAHPAPLHRRPGAGMTSMEPATTVVSIATPDQQGTIQTAFCNQVHFFPIWSAWPDGWPEGYALSPGPMLMPDSFSGATLSTAKGGKRTRRGCHPRHPRGRATTKGAVVMVKSPCLLSRCHGMTFNSIRPFRRRV
jgi:hypothetical protein